MVQRELLLIRSASPFGVFGLLYLDGAFFAPSVECHWRGNQTNVSCVPAGEYDLVLFNSGRFSMLTRALRGGTVGVHHGEGARYACLIHPANKADQLNGCIALGDRVKNMGGTQAVWNSERIVRKLLDSLGDDPARLSIQWAVNPEGNE